MKQFPKKLKDRQEIAEKLRKELPGFHVVCGDKGYPFIEISDGDNQPGRFVMWDNKDFQAPAVFEQIRRNPRQMWRGKIIHTAPVPLICEGAGWMTHAVHVLAMLAKTYLAKGAGK